MDTIAAALSITPLSDKDLLAIDEYVNKNAGSFVNTCSQRGELNSFYGRKHTAKSKHVMSSKARGNKNFLGHKHTDESKKKMSIAKLGKPGNRKGKTPWNKGIKCLEETKQKISKSKTGSTHSEEAKKKMKLKALTRPKITCEKCNKTVDSSNYARWHGKNCKLNA